jgi:predicted CXXCH cytochrome family protein
MPPIKFVISLLLFISLSASSESAKQCVDCHAQAVSDWQQSDHAKAMALAIPINVLGDFSGTSVSHFTQTVKFYTKDDKFLINFSQGDVTNTYEVAYTFGHYPLQEYLIESENGRFQVFPFAWDSRPAAQGGQRWYPVYPDEDIQTADRLHWQQPLQNWNGMCADCHSDGLKRNYSPPENSFKTQWDNINVGCQSCHNKLDDSHYKNPQKTKILLSSQEAEKVNHWLLGKDDKVAKWQGKPRDNSFMDTCFGCHSLRSPLSDGIEPSTPFLEQFSPTLLSQPLYHADGQIKDEVYVYGSFLQSKMYAAGVNCLDCHNKHTMKIKADNNGLCLQCHSAEAYQTPKHLVHEAESAGAQCVNCHMPQTTYMGVDARRDHSFRIPRPELTEPFDVPNACNGCHQDKSPSWAETKIKSLYGHNNPLSQNEKNYILLQHNQYLPVSDHMAIARDQSLNEIYRASAISLLPNSIQELKDADINKWVTSPLPLVRLATARIGFLLSEAEKRKSYSQLLTDKFKAIRVMAASHMVTLNSESPQMLKALNELITSYDVSAWRGEGGLNKGILLLNMQQFKPAITALKQSIDVEPYFEAGYINLADLYRVLQEPEKEQEVLSAGLRNNPKSGMLYFSHAMHQIRQQDKNSAIKSLEKAIKLSPDNAHYAYVYFIALDSVGKTQQALARLKMVIKKYAYNPQLIELGLSFSQKSNDRNAYQHFMNLMNNPN